MIAYFPTVYEDELLYSVIARYHEHSGNIAAKHTIEELFGNQKYVASFEFPTQLKLMHDKLSIFNVLSLHEWIEKHTLYAYYTNFLNEESKEKIYQGMIERRKVEVLQNTAGINTTTIKPRPYFKFCPECVKEDMLDLGETYWRMSHQLPSMFLCLKHSTLLRDSTVLVREINRHSFFSANPLNCLENDTVPVPAYSHKTMQLLLAIAKQSLILSNKNWNSNPDEVHAAYRYLLYSNGYKSVSGNTDLKKLTEDFQQFYGEEFLRLMQSSIDINDSSCWLHKIARKHSDRSFHPIRHLLFIHFLGETVEGVLDRNALSFEPFGSGPFPCLNVACNYYKQLIIPNVIITRDYDTGAPIGTFTCSCGFTYARKGPDSKCEDRYRIGKIKTFGSVWLEKLREYIVVDKKSLTETSKLLHSNRHTVSKYFSRITAESENFSSKISNNTVEDNYKKEWLELCKKYPHLSKTELRKKGSSIYTWIYRHDKDWLQRNSPSVRKYVVLNKRVDWDRRDQDVLLQISIVVEKLKEQIPLIRLTKNRIGKEFGNVGLIVGHLDKLAHTKRYLEEVLETVEDFQVRRVRWVVQQLEKENIPLTIWRIKQRAALGTKPLLPKVENEIEQWVD